MQLIAIGNMGLLVPMIISLLLIVGGGGLHPILAMATPTAPNLVTPMTYWEAVLPGIPMLPAISDLLAEQNVISPEDHDATVSSHNLKFVKGLRKMGPNNERVVSEPDRADKHVYIAQEVEDNLKEISVSYGSQGQEYMEKGIILHDTKVRKDLKGQSISHESLVTEEVEKTFTPHKPKTAEHLKEISVSYGLDSETDTTKVSPNVKNILETYRPHNQENLREISVSYGSNGGEDLKEISVSYGLEGGKDLKEAPISHGVAVNDILKEISMSYGVEGGEGVKEISMSYGIEQNKNPVEVMTPYGKEQGNLKEISVSYGVEGGEGVKEISMSYGIEQNNPMEVMASYGKEQGNLKEISVSYGVEGGEGVKEISMSYGIEQNKNPMEVMTSFRNEQGNLKEISVSYGSEEGKQHRHNEVLNQGEEDPHKVTMSYASEKEEQPKTYSTRHEARIEGTAEESHHAHAHNHNNKRQQADVFFFHDMLRPGSIITPTIPPTTSLPLLLPRHIASSIPFSTEHLSDIIAMFSPASLRMTREIRWTLETCEHPKTLPGQKAGCATSLESLTELSSSLLRTRHVHAFSAADLPVEAPGTRALRGRYNVTAVRKLSGESSEIVTCHDLTYPYAVYYCHTANPTAAYTVTLASVEEDTGGAPATMEALAVCHLDTSQWSPKNPFFELHNVKPGEVTVCHFLTKLSIIWVPGTEQGGTVATA